MNCETSSLSVNAPKNAIRVKLSFRYLLVTVGIPNYCRTNKSRLANDNHLLKSQPQESENQEKIVSRNTTKEQVNKKNESATVLQKCSVRKDSVRR